MPYINVGEENTSPIDIHYDDVGVGRPIVLIHGFPLRRPARGEKQIPPLLNAGFSRHHLRPAAALETRASQASGTTMTPSPTTSTASLTELDLHDIVLGGFSMGGGEVARYLGNVRPPIGWRAAVLISSIPPFLLKTPETPNGLDQSVFDDIQAADRS